MCFFFFNDTATTEIYTLSLHDALPIFGGPNGYDGRGSECESRQEAERHRSSSARRGGRGLRIASARCEADRSARDRKSTRLNSSHANISYAVFCLKKKKRKLYTNIMTI